MLRQSRTKFCRKIGQAVIPGLILIILLTQLGQFAQAQTGTDADHSELTPILTPTPVPTDLPTLDVLSEPPPATPPAEERERLLRLAASETFGPRLPADQVGEVGLTKIVDDWAYVNFRVQVAEVVAEPDWAVYLGLAHWDGMAWTVAPEDSAEFSIWLDQIPAELLPSETRSFLNPAGSTVANAPGLWLPFPVGQTWKFLAGPNGGPRREAVDFGPFDSGEGETPSPSPRSPLTGRERDVTAAATGIVIDRDAHLLVLRHGSNPVWETGYYSLAADSNISQIGQVIYQGERIGAASAEGDPSKGMHVHFWVRQAGIDQAITGQLLSDWQIYQDNSYAVGQNTGRIVYRNGSERIDCQTVERQNLSSDFCHVHHFSITPAPLPVTMVSLIPSDAITIPVGDTGVISVEVDSTANLYQVDLQLTYTPTLPVLVVDAFPDTSGVQVAPGSIFDNVPFTLIQNEVNTQTGVIHFAASRQVPAPAFNGIGSLLEITWQRELTGPVEVSLADIHLADPNGRTIPITVTAGTISLQSGFVLQGQVELQGKENWGGVTVTTANQHADTGPDGQFAVGVAGAYQLELTAPGYLSARAAGNPLDLALPDAATLDLGRIILRAGEVTGDDQIDIFDLAVMASRYGQPDPLADINQDGTVNIFDLALVAANYGQRGPVAAWQ